MVFKKSLRSCALDENSFRIGRVDREYHMQEIKKSFQQVHVVYG